MWIGISYSRDPVRFAHLKQTLHIGTRKDIVQGLPCRRERRRIGARGLVLRGDSCLLR